MTEVSRRAFLSLLPAAPVAIPAVAPEFGPVVAPYKWGRTFATPVKNVSQITALRFKFEPSPQMFEWLRRVDEALLDIGAAADEPEPDWRDWPSSDPDDEHAYIASAAAALGGE